MVAVARGEWMGMDSECSQLANLETTVVVRFLASEVWKLIQGHMPDAGLVCKGAEQRAKEEAGAQRARSTVQGCKRAVD